MFTLGSHRSYSWNQIVDWLRSVDAFRKTYGNVA